MKMEATPIKCFSYVRVAVVMELPAMEPSLRQHSMLSSFIILLLFIRVPFNALSPHSCPPLTLLSSIPQSLCPAVCPFFVVVGFHPSSTVGATPVVLDIIWMSLEGANPSEVVA